MAVYNHALRCCVLILGFLLSACKAQVENEATLLPLSATKTAVPSASGDIELVGHTGGIDQKWGRALDVAVSGAYAYIAAGECLYRGWKPDCSGELRIVSVSDPESPIEAGYYPVQGRVNRILLKDDYLYATVQTADGGELQILDVSNPAKLVLVSSVKMNYPPVSLAARDSYIYIAAGGMQAINVSIPIAPIKVAYHASLGPLCEQIRSAYRDPSAPELSVHAWSIAVEGDYAYLGEGCMVGIDWLGGGVQAVNISQPAQPDSVSFYETSGPISSVTSVDQHVYAADVTGEIQILDVSNPNLPNKIGFFEAGWPQDIVVENGYLYIADMVDGVQIVDITDSAHPFEVGNYSIQGHSYAVAIKGDYIYLVNEENGLFILKFTVPA